MRLRCSQVTQTSPPLKPLSTQFLGIEGWLAFGPHDLLVGYRKGREVALAEQDAKVRELVETVMQGTCSYSELRALAKALKP